MQRRRKGKWKPAHSSGHVKPQSRFVFPSENSAGVTLGEGRLRSGSLQILHEIATPLNNALLLHGQRLFSLISVVDGQNQIRNDRDENDEARELAVPAHDPRQPPLLYDRHLDLAKLLLLRVGCEGLKDLGDL